MRGLLGLAVAIALLTTQLHAQSGMAAACTVPEALREYCLIAAQTVESAQPQLGILIAGGNPTLGTASTGGLRLGFLPRVSATAKANVVLVRLPDIITEGAGRLSQQLNRTAGIPAPALSGTVSAGILPGFDVVPLFGGIGSVDLLATATWLPLRLVGVSGVGDEASSIAYGGGVRLGLLRESFVAPGVSASLIYRRLGQIEYGDVCPDRPQYQAGSGVDTFECPGEGDLGEFSFGLTNWSTRLAASKRLLGVGLTAGIGYDRFASDVAFGFRVPDDQPGSSYYGTIRGEDLSAGRWSGFLNGSFTALVATMAVEAGWMQGSDPIGGFEETASRFDPNRGTFFGSLGVRLAL